MQVTLVGIESQTQGQAAEECLDIEFHFAGEYFWFATDDTIVNYVVPWALSSARDYIRMHQATHDFTGHNREIVDFVHKVNGKEEISLDFEEFPTILRTIFSEILNQ